MQTVFAILLTVLPYLLPAALLALPVLLFFDIRLKKAPSAAADENPPRREPDIAELEEKLSRLLQANRNEEQTAALQKELQQSPSGLIAAYLKTEKKDLKGFHLFQLIFSLLKNRTDDAKIIRILRHYLPSCATSHLYAVLRSCKIFLSLHRRNPQKTVLPHDLNRLRLRQTLLYLEKQINHTLNLYSSAPEEKRRLLLDRTAIYGLVFAAFSEFYDKEATAKILRLSHSLSPEIFLYWHSVPRTATLPYPLNDAVISRIEAAPPSVPRPNQRPLPPAATLEH